MLWEQTLEKIRALKLSGMLEGIKEQEEIRGYSKMDFEERLGFLIDREYSGKEERRLRSRIKQAKMKQQACVEDIDFKSRRNLNKSEFLKLSQCKWIKERRNLIITGPTGVGKSYLSCALGHKACLNNLKVQYVRLPRFLVELGVSRGDGSYLKLIKSLMKVELLILDDWGLSKFTEEQRKDFLEIMEDRYEARSTIITSQLPVSSWHQVIGESTVADAILDRLVHNSYRVELEGESMRKNKVKEAKEKEKENDK
jgi:DNA replication protein DnaC